jgi:glycosyltransferase involved in cell wall biosynthesis
MRIAAVFDNFGPYHLARLSAAGRQCQLLGIEVARQSAEYAWSSTNGSVGFQRKTLLERGTSAAADAKLLAARLDEELAAFQAEAVAVPGWSSQAAFLTLRWCLRHRVPAVLMSESQAIDKRRRAFAECIKRRYLRSFRSALVGGRPHREYLIQLGMPPERICFGYDAVDNRWFEQGADTARAKAVETRARLRLPPRYFLASSRFIPKKNLPCLLRAFARYRRACAAAPWDLVLLGDGPLRGQIESLLASLQLTCAVQLPGFRQYDELPGYYGLAGAFVHASTSEQWGLVVNEAMASGLPVIVSDRCGCAMDLVSQGENGFLFDPSDEAGLARHMQAVVGDEDRRRTMGRLGRERIRDWGPERFARGLVEAAECALRAGPPPTRWIDHFLLHLLTAKRA